MQIKYLIVGLGKTGLSCLRYCLKQGWPVAVTDSRKNPPGKDELLSIAPDTPYVFGELSAELIKLADCLLLSPGVDLKTPVIAQAIATGKPFLGDVELFLQAVSDVPVIGITGSNAKSTVTTLVGEIAEACGEKVKVVGNIGTPVLDAIDHTAQWYVMELSSFQLETTKHLSLKVAAILNISEDHMDRYETFADYVAAKQKIYHQAETVVFNRADQLTFPVGGVKDKITFALNSAKNNKEYGLIEKNDQLFLAVGETLLLAEADIYLQGRHHLENALAALAITDAAGLSVKVALKVIKGFKGLSHRCQLIGEDHGVAWINDSKATNVGATVAALNGLGNKKNIILIAGGVGKGADFAPLKDPIEKQVKSLLLIGEAAKEIEGVCHDSVSTKRFSSLARAVSYAKMIAEPGDKVILSPACASFDMFDDFEHRGNEFCNLVDVVLSPSKN